MGKRHRASLSRQDTLPAALCLPTQKLSQPWFGGVVWKLHCKDMTDSIIGHWWLSWLPTPLSSPAIHRCFPEVTYWPYLYGSEMGDKRPNKEQKMIALLLSLRESRGFGELWARNCRWKPNIYEEYVWDQMTQHIFLSNHSIAGI